MASVLPRPVTFASRGGLGFTAPPKPPSKKKTYGSFCFRATCMITDETLGCPVAKVKGYDKSPQIGPDTEGVCKSHARGMGRQYACGEAEVVMLPTSDLTCLGEVFLVMDGTVRRLV